MKFYLIALFLFSTLSSFATVSDPSERLMNYLTSLKVDTFGKSSAMYADLHCKIKVKGPFCTIISVQEEIDLIAKYEGDDALDLMSILKDFGVDSEGKNQIQWARIVCKLPKGLKIAPRVCTVQPNIIIDP